MSAMFIVHPYNVLCYRDMLMLRLHCASMQVCMYIMYTIYILMKGVCHAGTQCITAVIVYLVPVHKFMKTCNSEKIKLFFKRFDGAYTIAAQSFLQDSLR